MVAAVHPGVWWWCVVVVAVVDHACSLVKKESLVEQKKNLFKKNLPEARDMSTSQAPTAVAVIAVGGPSHWQ